MWGVLIQEKWPNLGKNSEFCDVSIYFNLIPSPQLHGKTDSFATTVTVQTISLAATRADRAGLEIPKSFTPIEPSLLDLFGKLLKNFIFRTGLYLSWIRALSVQKFYVPGLLWQQSQAIV